MAITVLLSTCSILMIFYSMKPKKGLHLMEILFCWMTALFFYAHYVTVLSENLILLDTIDTRLDLVWSFFIFKIMFIPILVIWCIDLTLSTHGYWIRWFVFFMFILILTGAEYVAVWLQIFHYLIHWKLWWSMIAWTFLLFCVFFLLKWFRHILKKDLRT